MKRFAIPVTITLVVTIDGVDRRDATARLEDQGERWMEPVTQGDARVHFGPAIELASS